MKTLPGKAWHHLPTEEVLSTLETDQESGLNEQEVEARLQTFGPNRISTQKSMSALKRLLLQFHNPLIYLLLVATGVTFLLQEYVDSGVIFAVVLVNAIIGYLQESKAEAAINSLQSKLSARANVVRAGKKVSVSASNLVPGDIVLLTSGDRVPADLRLVQNRNLQVDESMLTGESVAVEKDLTLLDEDAVLGDRVNLSFAGTLVTYGQGTGVVVATGDGTETGKIADLIAGAVSLATPLTRKIETFSRILLWVILALAVVTFGVGMLHGQPWVDNFMAAVALSVAAIPEGLPAVVTITLAIGVRRMASRHAIVRKLPAVETLGSTTIICSDKTGTLTENQMTVEKILVGETSYDVSGTGYQPEGELTDPDGTVADPLPAGLVACLRAGTLCNDSQLKAQDDRWQVTGDPTEGALLVAAVKGHVHHDEVTEQYPRLDVVPFESDQQYMATLHEFDDDHHMIYLKGSLEKTLERCQDALDTQGEVIPLDHDAITDRANQFARMGLRVLALAQQTVPAAQTDLHEFQQQGTAQLTFLGLQAMIDPPREEAIQAVRACQDAGIVVKMITGDHALTASAIAGKIGIADAAGNTDNQQALTGRELAELSDDELRDAAETVSVFARVAPEQKLNLVKALQSRQHVVAMTGDGVNDAPALKKANIGIAMGITGTEVAREAADMVLTDDNFASIEAAVEEGRNVFDNLVKFITWILPTNLGQGLVITVAIFLGATLPVLPVQALWLNMTTAVFLGLMLAFEPREPGIMQRPPRAPESPILNREMLTRILSVSALLLLGAFSLFEWTLSQGEPIEVARTLAVTLFVVVQSAFLLNCRSLTVSLFRTAPFSNLWIWGGIGAMLLAQLAYIYTPMMNTLFHSAPLTLTHWAIMVVYGVIVLLLVEGEKALWRRHKRPRSSLTTER